MNRLRLVDERLPGADGGSQRRVHPSVWRHFIAHPDDRLQVVVSIDAPQPDLSGMIAGASLQGREKVSKPDPSSIDSIADSVRKGLAEIGVEILNWLPSSQAFVVELTAEEIDEVSKIANVLEIIPNKKMK